MPFIDCLTSAVDQGALTKEEAAELARDFDRRFAQARLQMGDESAAAAARAALEKDIRADAAERKRRVNLTEAARVSLARDLQGYRSATGQPDILGAALQKLSSYGTAGFSSLRGRFEAVLGLAHAELADHIRTFRRTNVTGRRLNRPLADDVMRELHGEATGKPEAAGLAGALGRVAEDLRQRFNAAGGAIPKLEKWGWTHSHNRSAVARAGRDEWKRIIRPMLDDARMVDPLTGDPADVERLLDVTWENIVSDSWARHRPEMRPFGRGALAGQRQEHRYLVFKSADAWLEYDAAFGSGDPVAAWFEHIKGMARDIAAMETFGPNPGAMVEWMKQVVRKEIGRKQAGIPGALAKKAGIDAGPYADWRIDALYEYLRGRPSVSSRMARLTGDVRNTMTAALLGSTTILAAATDPFIERAARKLAGLPMRGSLTAALKTFSSGPREHAVRAGFIADDFVHILRDEARYAGFLDGNEWSRILADRALTWNLLKPLTEARRHVHQLEWQATLADHAETGFDQLPDLLRRAMQGFGIDATDWDVMRSAALFRPAGSSAGFLRPVDVAALADGPALPQVQKALGLEGDEAIVREQVRAGVRRTAEKLVEMVQSWTERAVPAGTPNARSFVTGAAKRGTIAGELLEGLLQFKSFALSFTTLQIQAAVTMAAAKGPWSAARYAGGLAIGLTLGGALYMELKSIADGKDSEDISRPDFWVRALMTGGGLGLFGDFLLSDYARNGHSPLSAVGGPGVSFVQDVGALTLGNLRDLAKGDKTYAGRELRNFLGRYTPVVSTHWATRGAWNRIFLDQLQYLVDPAAKNSFSAKMQTLERQTGQKYFWEPGGGPLPQRPPNLGAAIGR